MIVKILVAEAERVTVGSKLRKQTAVAVTAIREYQVADLAVLKMVVGFIICLLVVIG